MVLLLAGILEPAWRQFFISFPKERERCLFLLDSYLLEPLQSLTQLGGLEAMGAE